MARTTRDDRRRSGRLTGFTSFAVAVELEERQDAPRLVVHDHLACPSFGSSSPIVSRYMRLRVTSGALRYSS